MRQIDKLPKEKQKKMLRNIPVLVKTYFNDKHGNDYELQDWQENIVEAVFYKNPDRYGVKAVTRGGKTEAVAIGEILRAMFNSGEEILNIAPRHEQSDELMQYVTQHLTDHPDIVASLADPRKASSEDRLKRELSSDRITFKNGSQIKLTTANINGDGENLQGKGGTLIVVDEIELIPESIINNQITRMLGESPDSSMVMMTNPVHKRFFYNRMDDERWTIDTYGWRDAVRNGRLTKEFVEEQRNVLSKREFTMWYEAEYPESVEDGLIDPQKVDKAVEEDYSFFKGHRVHGLDVAGEGQDLNVLSSAKKFLHPKYEEEYIHVFNVKHWDDGDTTVTEDKAMARMEADDSIAVDAIGIGKGVGDTIKGEGYHTQLIKFSNNPTIQEDRFENYKAQLFFKLKDMIENERIALPDIKEMKEQLKRVKIQSSEKTGKTEIVYEDGKSPDFADSLALLMATPSASGFTSATTRKY